MLTTDIELQTKALLDELEKIKLDPAETELVHGLRDLKGLAKDILKDCSGPVRLGILGEFSAGKTRLIEAILGLADRLPTGEIPSTGNIAEFHCKAVPGLKRSEFGGFDAVTGKFTAGPGGYEVVFVTHQEACDFLEFLRGEAALIFTVRDTEFRDALDAVPVGDWDRWRAWAEQVFENAPRYDLRFLALEAFRFAQAYQACGALLQGQRVVVADKAVADTAMTLAATAGRAVDSGLPACPPVLTSVPKSISKELMASLFPLVRVVELNVGLPEELGRVLQGDGNEPFVVVDCPGLGAEESTLRDKFLCLRELRSVESILIVVDSRRPGSNGAVLLHDMMRDAWNTSIRDRILVALGRFDQVLGNPAKQEAAEALARSTEPLTADDLLEQFRDPLGKLVNNGRKPLEDGRLDRVSVVSGNVALWALMQKHPDLTIGDESFYRQAFNDEAVRAIDKSREIWTAIARRLRTGAATDKLYADWFREYGADGGLSRLKHTCRAHLDEHGSTNLNTKVLNKFAGLKTARQVFESALSALEARSPRTQVAAVRQAGPSTVELGKAALRLSGIYQGVIAELTTRGVKPLTFRPAGRINLVGVLEYLREESIARIGDWDEWKLLFDNVDPMHGPGQIKVIDPQDQVDPAGDGPRGTRNRRSKAVPTRTDDFFASFSRTIRQVEAIANVVCKDSIRLLLDEHAAKVREALGQDATPIAAAITSADLNDRLVSVEPDADERDEYAYALKGAIAPTTFLEDLAKVCLAMRDGADDDDKMRSIFPLALKSKDGTRIGRIFHWEADVAAKYGAQMVHGRHQIHVIRNRQAIEESAVFHISRVVEGYRRSVTKTLSGYYGGLSQNLKRLSEAAD